MAKKEIVQNGRQVLGGREGTTAELEKILEKENQASSSAPTGTFDYKIGEFIYRTEPIFTRNGWLFHPGRYLSSLNSEISPESKNAITVVHELNMQGMEKEPERTKKARRVILYPWHLGMIGCSKDPTYVAAYQDKDVLENMLKEILRLNLFNPYDSQKQRGLLDALEHAVDHILKPALVAENVVAASPLNVDLEDATPNRTLDQGIL